MCASIKASSVIEVVARWTTHRAINTTTTIPSTATMREPPRRLPPDSFLGVVAGGAGAFAGDGGNAFGFGDAEPTVWVEGGPFMRDT